MKTVIYFQARIAGVHDLLNHFWNGMDFVEGIKVEFTSDVADREIHRSKERQDFLYNNGWSFIDSNDIIVETK